jgi:hypothetical protein
MNFLFVSFKKNYCDCCRAYCSRRQVLPKMVTCWRLYKSSMEWPVKCPSNWSVRPARTKNRECQGKALMPDRLPRTSRLWDLRRTSGIYVYVSIICKLFYNFYNKNSVASVLKRSIPTERPPLVNEVSANFLRIEGTTWSAWRIPTPVFSAF